MRKWIGISGHNIPSFELFLSPDWRGTQGVYFADQPSYRSGNYVEGVKLTFKNGRAVKIEAETGENFVIKQLAMDKGADICNPIYLLTYDAKDHPVITKIIGMWQWL